MADDPDYAARLEIDYPEKLDRLTTFFRLVWIIPIAIILGLLSGAGQTTTVVLNETGEVVRRTRDTAGGLASSLAVATAPTWYYSPANIRRPSKNRLSTWKSTTPT